MQAFELTITGDGPTTNTRFIWKDPPSPGPLVRVGQRLDWSPSPNSAATWQTGAAASEARMPDQAAGSAISGAQAVAARRLQQEEAPQGEPVTASLGTRLCISLSRAAPGPITLQPHEWDVSGQAARMPDILPAAG